jgi:hypothetical protein
MCGAFYIYTLDYYRSDATVQAMLNTADGVSVTQSGGMISFAPDGKAVDTGLVFYPGGKVEWTAYAPLLRQIAQRGYLCVLVKMPFNLAMFDVNAADRAMAAHPEIKSWYIGGHSLGGVFCTSYAGSHADKLRGIVLLGSYTISDLSHTGLKALVLVGTEDKGLDRTAFEKSKAKMPAGTVYMEIQGGNHAQFGNYGAQKGDGTATITQEQQQQIAVDAIVKFFGS